MESYKSGYPTGDLWAVIDPGWGDPFLVLGTISTSPEESKRLGCVSPDISLYSGASTHTQPPRPGDWDKLVAQGFTLKRIRIEIE